MEDISATIEQPTSDIVVSNTPELPRETCDVQAGVNGKDHEHGSITNVSKYLDGGNLSQPKQALFLQIGQTKWP